MTDIQVAVEQPAAIQVQMLAVAPQIRVQTSPGLSVRAGAVPIAVELAAVPALYFDFPGGQGASGPPGIQGIQGVPGADGTNTLISFEARASGDGAQVLTLPYAIASGWRLLCINGLRQSVTGYSVSGNALSLPSALAVSIGDLISFDFYPSP